MTWPSNGESVAPDQLRAFVERIERMHEERRAIGDDIKEIYAEAKGNGFDTKALKIVIRHREQDIAERLELEAIVDLYKSALGMQDAPRDDDDHVPGRGVPAPARAREIIEEFGTETGEITEQPSVQKMHKSPEPAQPDPSGVAAVGGEGVDATLAANQSTAALTEVRQDIRPDTATGDQPAKGRVAKSEGVVSLAGAGDAAAGTPAPPVDTKPIRPFCLKPSNCGGQGRVHCYSCSKAHADEVEAA